MRMVFERFWSDWRIGFAVAAGVAAGADAVVSRDELSERVLTTVGSLQREFAEARLLGPSA